MTDTPRPKPPAPAAKKILAASLALLVLLLLLAAAAKYAYDTAHDFDALRNNCLLALIVAAVGITVCLAGFIYFLDLPLRPREAEGFDRSQGPRWYMRLLLAFAKWLAMVLQLAAMALALAAAGILIFGFAIPGTAEPPPRPAHALTRPIAAIPALMVISLAPQQ